MPETNHPIQNKVENTKLAVFVAQNIGLNNIFSMLLSIYVVFTTGGAWQGYVCILLALEIALGGFIAAYMFRRGEDVRAGWVLLITNYIAPALAAWVLANFSLISLAYLVVSSYFIYTYATPKKSRRLAIVTFVIALAVPLLADLVRPASQLVSPIFLTVAPIIVSILTLIFIGMVLRQAWASNIRARLLATFIALAVIPTFVTVGVTIFITSQNARSEALNEVSTIAQIKFNQINFWLATLQTDLQIMMLNENISSNTGLILSNTPEADAAKIPLREKFRQYNQTSAYFTELFIVDEAGTLLVSTNETQEGKIVSNLAYFREGLKGPYIASPAYDVALQDYSIIFSQPIQDESGKTIGVLAGRANLDVLSSIMQQTIEESTTNETYLVGANYALLTHLKFAESKIGETYLRTDGVTRIIETQQEGASSYNDYRDVPVLGAYLWVPSLQIAVISEQDESEALQGANLAFAIAIGLILITILLASLAAVLVTRTIANPILQLVSTAEKISQGNLDTTATVQSQDEIGTLANAFNTMTFRLRETLQGLETRVTERTKALATSSEISRRLSTILNSQQLAVQVVNLLQSGFNYYHAHIYLFDEEGEYLVMAGGTGEAGKSLLERGHRIPRGRGLVGRAAETKQIVLARDTSQEPGWLPNPLLPNTKAEVAVPILVGEKVLGVLDVQNDSINSLGEQDADLVRTIADQVGIALQNIRATEISTKRATELQTVAFISTSISTLRDAQEMLATAVRLTQRRFNLYHCHIFTYHPETEALAIKACGWKAGDEHEGTHGTTTIPLDQEQSLVARAARTRKFVLVNNVRSDPGWLPNPLLPDTQAELAVPMLVGDLLLGVLDVQSDKLNAFTEEDANIQTTLASQIGTALQNIYSYTDAQHQAEREALLNQVSQKIQATNSVEMALMVTARELGHALGKKQTIVSIDASAKPSVLEP